MTKRAGRPKKGPVPLPQRNRPLFRTSVAGERDFLAVDLGQGVHGGLLLGLLLVPPPGGGIALPANERGDLEAFAVVGTLLVEEVVLRRGAELALGHLLQQRLVI